MSFIVIYTVSAGAIIVFFFGFSVVFCSRPTLLKIPLHYFSIFTHHSHLVPPNPGGALSAVQVSIDHRRDRFNLCAELLLDSVEVEPVLVGDEVDGQTQVPEATRSANTM